MKDKQKNDSNSNRKLKVRLHPKNKHKGSYNFKILSEIHPPLNKFVRPTKYEIDSIDFSNPEAVKALNTALLKYYYKIEFWDIPKNYLCPPIPGRADYIHHVAQLLGSKNSYKIPMNGKVTCLDIGVGANCIYPIIGHQEYGWKFIGTDIDEVALKSAKNIINSNQDLKNNIELRFQKDLRHIFEGIIKETDQIDLVVCNPPFHSSEKELNKSALRKNRNLNLGNNVNLNFGGTNKELWCDGGEKQFITTKIFESEKFSKSCFWFTTLVSKKENLKSIYQQLKKTNPHQIKTIHMGQGNKQSRIVAWTYLTEDEQENWMHNKWHTWIKKD